MLAIPAFGRPGICCAHLTRFLCPTGSQDAHMSAAVPLPDLLRRFVLTPYRFSAVAGSVVISFETNDQELLAGFRDRTEQLVSALKLPSHNTWHWKLVRDH